MSRPNQDFVAAMHEVESNLEVRRLMLVLTNVLTPTCLMAVSDCLGGANYPESTAWLPRCVVPMVGGLLLLSGVFVTGVLARCHFGLVLNGTKMRKVETGALQLCALNWLGVTTNFVWLTALSAALGAAALVAGLGYGRLWPWAAGAVWFLLMLWLPACHVLGNRRCRVLDAAWQHEPPPPELREEHLRKSLDGTSADISVVVVMAVALFAGVFNTLTNLGGILDGIDMHPAPDVLRRVAFPVLCAFLLLSLALSCRMLVRLRLAYGEHASALAAVRSEPDATARRWRPMERTFLLYAIVLVLAAASACMLAFEQVGPRCGLWAAVATFGFGAVWYPLVLRFRQR